MPPLHGVVFSWISLILARFCCIIIFGKLTNMSLESFHLENENIDNYSYNLESISAETQQELAELDQEIFEDKVFSISEVQTVLENANNLSLILGVGTMLSVEIGMEFLDKFIPNLSCHPGEITGSLTGSRIAEGLSNFAKWYNKEYSKLEPIEPSFGPDLIKALSLVIADTLRFTGKGFESKMQKESASVDLESPAKWKATLHATDVNGVSLIAYTQGDLVIYKNLYNPVLYNRNGDKIGFMSGGIYHFHEPSNGWPPANYEVKGPITNQFEGYKRIARLSTFRSPELGDTPGHQEVSISEEESPQEVKVARKTQQTEDSVDVELVNLDEESVYVDILHDDIYSIEFTQITTKSKLTGTDTAIIKLSIDENGRIETQKAIQFLRKPENLSLIENSHLSNPRRFVTELNVFEKQRYKEILIIIKLLMLKDSSTPFIRITEEKLTTSESSSFLDSSSELKSGILPLTSKLATQGRLEFVDENDRPISDTFTKGLEGVEVILDSLTMPTLKKVIVKGENGEKVKKTFVRVKYIYTKTGAIVPPSNFFIALENLKSTSGIQDFQKSISVKNEFSGDESDSEIDFSDLEKIKLLSTQDDYLLIEAMSNIDVIFSKYGHKKTKDLIDLAIKQKPSSILGLSQNLSLIRKLFPTERSEVIGRELIEYIYINSATSIQYFLRDIREFKLFFKEKFESIFLKLQAKIKEFDMNTFRPRINSESGLRNLELIFINSEFLFGSQSERVLKNFLDLNILEQLSKRPNFKYLIQSFGGAEYFIEIFDEVLSKMSFEILLRTFDKEDIKILINKIIDKNLHFHCLLKNINQIDSLYSGEFTKLIIECCIKEKEFELLLSNLHKIWNLKNKWSVKVCIDIIQICKKQGLWSLMIRHIENIKLMKDEELTLDILNGLLNSRDWNFLFKNLKYYKEKFPNTFSDLLIKIVDKAEADKSYKTLICNPDFIISDYKPDGQLRYNQIVDSHIDKLSSYFRLSSMLSIKKFYRPNGPRKVEEIVEKEIHNNNWSNIFLNLDDIKAVFEPVGREKCEEILNIAIKQKRWGDILNYSSFIKRGLGANLYKKFVKTAIEESLKAQDWTSLLTSLDDMNSTQRMEIVQMAIKAKEWDALLQNFSEIWRLVPTLSSKILTLALKDRAWIPLLENTWEIRNVDPYLFESTCDKMLNLDLNKSELILFLDSFATIQKTETQYLKLVKLAIDSRDPEIFQHVVVSFEFVSDYLLDNIDTLANAFADNFESILDSIIVQMFTIGLHKNVLSRYKYLVDLLPNLDSILLREPELIIRNYEDLDPELSFGLLSDSLLMARRSNMHSVLFKYIPKMLEAGVLDDLPDIDISDFRKYTKFKIPDGADIYDTDNGFELVIETSNRFADIENITNLNYEVLQYNNNFELIDEITAQDLSTDLVHLQHFGISYFSHLMRPYSYLKNIIESRYAFEKKDKKFFAGKRFQVIFHPKSDYNRAFNNPDSQTFDKSENTLYFEISKEDDMYDILRDLEAFGVHIDLLTIGGHGSQTTTNFNEAGDPSNAGFKTKNEEAVLNLGDETDLQSLRELTILRGSEIFIKSCSSGSRKLSRKSVADMISRTIGNKSKVTAPMVSVGSPNFSYQTNNYSFNLNSSHYKGSKRGQSYIPLFIEDNRPKR